MLSLTRILRRDELRPALERDLRTIAAASMRGSGCSARAVVQEIRA